MREFWLVDLTDEEKLANTRAEMRAYDALPKRVRTILRCARIDISARKTYTRWTVQERDTATTAWQLLDWLKSKGAR